MNIYVGDVKIPTQVIKYNQCFSNRISQSDCRIHIIFNYLFVDCKGTVCYNGGTLDPDTCQCRCTKVFKGRTCQQRK